jgi:hypothetical protein
MRGDKEAIWDFQRVKECQNQKGRGSIEGFREKLEKREQGTDKQHCREFVKYLHMCSL